MAKKFSDKPDIGGVDPKPPMPNIGYNLKVWIDDWLEKTNKRGYMMPENSVDAAKWWLETMQEPRRDTERSIKKYRKDGDGYFWESPYLFRLTDNLKTYITAPALTQKIIFGCAEEKVFWRGDEDMGYFYHNEHSVYNETKTMKEVGIDEYRKKGKALLGIFSASGNAG